MLILLPPSETKTVRTRGPAMDLEALSAPELTPSRREMADAVCAASLLPEAASLLDVNPNLVDQIARNQHLLEAPAVPAAELYTGVLYDAFDVPSLDPAAKRRAGRWTMIFSPLYGVLRLRDRVAPYRVSVCAKLPGPPTVHRYWRERLAPTMEAAAGSRGLIVDARSSSYHSMWTPPPSISERWVQVAVPGASHMAKHTRGLVARAIAEDAVDPSDPSVLTSVLAARFQVRLQEPERAGRPWTLSVLPS